MAGHSKWAGIKHKKAAIDAKRARRWTKLVREVIVSARLGGGDPDFNPRLRSAILDAKADNVPNDTIDRAIKKGTGELEGESFEEVSYEGYGPSGVAVLVEAMTDNRNRTVSELRNLFSRHGGNLGETGCVAWMFDRRGCFAIEPSAMSEEELMELALELGVEDFEVGEAYELFTAPEAYARVREELERRGVALAAAELAMIPQSTVELGESSGAVLRLMEALEDHDDVQHVWANFEVDEGILAAQASA
ncbi:MAG TPA: YebC/PmpR family DNA-binding transcriptional regulator [Thermoanaerobaculia bacterium]|nr:YebC/PmpR family DNA-binding transcriptional regulator [Thermoanaerobaculia bacterium]